MPVGLVLEGGGMRGAYTAGVLDTFMDAGISFPSIYGVSAGACAALSYVSGQQGRNHELFTKYVADERYVSVKNLRETGSLFGFTFIFGKLFHELMPFDWSAFAASPMQLYVGATNLNTGLSVFYSKEQMDDRFLPVQASSSLPFLSNIVNIDGLELLDGGVSAPVPLDRSIFDGNARNVVVLTRDFSYRKDARMTFPRAVIRTRYRDYPAFVDALQNRNDVYNSELAVIRRQERAGNAVVIRPSSPIHISRYEKDPGKLDAVYQMGLRDARAKLDAIKSLLKQDAKH